MDKKYLNNKFYVGSGSIFGRQWGHKTMDAAIQHGKELMDNENHEEVFVVQIIRVIRRKSTPIVVEVVR